MSAFAFALFSTAATAATLTVTNLNDSGPGSLRGQVAAAVTGDTINFSVVGTITLTSGMITIGNTGQTSLTVTGPGANQLTISGNGTSKIFKVDNCFATATISGLRLINGFTTSASGGAVEMGSCGGGNLTLNDMEFANNTAAGGQTGGAVYGISGTITLNRCLLTGNSATNGGGASSQGVINMNSCTLNGNSATSGGSAVFGFSSGFSLNLNNCTVSANTGVFALGSNTGGGINMRNTILAGNASGCSGTVNSQGFNLIQDPCSIGGSTTGNITGQSPNFGTLQNNGGPTSTRALLSNSPALNAADPASCNAFDQRGIVRPQGAQCDMGAFEQDQLAEVSVTISDGVTTVIPGSVVTYTITAGNAGPVASNGVNVTVPFGASFTSVSWTCLPSAGSTCGAPSGTGSIATTVNLASGGTATFTANATVDPAASGNVTVASTIAPPSFPADIVVPNNTATITNAIAPQGDLSVTITDGSTTAIPGTTITYTITGTNAGPNTAIGATVTDSFPPSIVTVTWTCSGTGTATCSTSGSGDINDSVTIPPGGTVTYTATATIASSATGSLSNTASIAAPSVLTDPNPANDSATDTDTLAPQADLAITKTDGVTAAVSGQSVTYTITATNPGPSTATGATVIDSFPASIATATWTCASTGGATCSPGGSGNINDSVTIPPGGTVTYTATATIASSATGSLSNTASIAPPSALTDPNPANDSATDTDTLAPQGDLAITKTDGVTAAVSGQSVTYTITATNAGPSTATGATVIDSFPAGIAAATWTCAATGGATCSAGGSGNINDSVTIPPGGTVTYAADAIIASSATGSLSNTASIVAPAGFTDSNPANDSATDTDALSQAADLSVTITDGTTTATPGTSTTYSIVVTNIGPSNAAGTIVNVAFPASVTGATWTCAASANSTCPASGSGDINAAASLGVDGTVTFTATAPISSSATGTLTTVAGVTAAAGVNDPAPSNNTASDADTLAPSADLAITLTGPASVTAGTSVVYTIAVNNNGPSAATGVVVSATPAGLTFVSNSGGCASAFPCVLGTVASGATITITSTWSVPAGSTSSVSLAASVAAATADPSPANSATSSTSAVNTSADVSITISAPPSATPGNRLSYTLTVSNAGPSDALGVTVTFPSPTNLVFIANSGDCTTPYPCSFGAIPAGATRTIVTTYSMPVSYALPDPVVTTATVSSTTADPSSTNNNATASVPVAPAADMAVAILVPSIAARGGQATLTTRIANNGPSDAFNITLSETLPAGIDFVSNSGACTTPFPCTFDSLAAGRTYEVTTRVSIPAGYNGGTPAVIRASVSAATPDAVVSNNSTSADLNIAACGASAPAQTYPTEGQSLASPVAFAWTAVADAVQYGVWITQPGGLSSLAGTTTDTFMSISLPAGAISWYVEANFGPDCPPQRSADRALTITPASSCGGQTDPIVLGPVGGVVVESPVTLSWRPAAGAIGYRVHVTVGGAETVVTSNPGATAVIVELPAGTITWYVEALFSGCPSTASQQATFSILPCTNRTATTLVAPAMNSISSSTDIEFRWTRVPNASGYRVWVSVDGAAANALPATREVFLRASIDAGLIDWFVETLFDGCASVNSEHQQFTILRAATCGTESSTLIEPAEGAITNTGIVNFSWTAVPDAVAHEVWLAVAGGTDTLLASVPAPATTFRSEVAPGTLEWFVRARINGCPSRDSQRVRFMYQPPAGCADVRPLLISPTQGASTVYSPVNFAFSAVANATAYRVFLADKPDPVATTTVPRADGIRIPSGVVRWYVEADRGGCPTVRSSVGEFIVVTPPSGCPVPPQPSAVAPSTVSSSVRYTVRFQPVQKGNTYTVYESRRADFADAATFATNSDHLDFAHPNGTPDPVTYFYRVSAGAPCNPQQSSFSATVPVTVFPDASTGSALLGSTPADDTQSVHYSIPLDPALAGQTFDVTVAEPWITVTPAHGVVSPGGSTIDVAATTTDLPIGTSSAAINILFTSVGASSRGTTHGATTTGSSKTVSVSLVPSVLPNPKNTPPPDALIIPAVAHANGFNSKFVSDVRITNTSPSVIRYGLTFVPTGEAGIAAGKQTTIDVNPGLTIALDDVLSTFFATGDGATGTLEVRPLTPTANSASSKSTTGLLNTVTFATSRMFNAVTNGGTFGQFVPAIRFANFIGNSNDKNNPGLLMLEQITQSAAFRTNLGLVEGSGDPASLLVSVFNKSGERVLDMPINLNGGQHMQLNSFLATRNLSVTDGRVEVRVTSPGGRVTAYASVIDNQTGDPLLVTPVPVPPSGASRFVIPGIADLSLGFANWRSDVRIFNPTADEVTATATFQPANAGSAIEKQIKLAPNQMTTLDSVVSSFFGTTNQGGAMRIETATNVPLVATARTYNNTSSGTYGQYIAAVTPDEGAGSDSRALQLLQVEESARFRTNVGIAEVTGKPAMVLLTAIVPGSRATPSIGVQLAPNQTVQFNQLLKQMGMSNTYNARISVKVIGGDGRVTAYASVIDAQTNDPTYVPAE